MQNASLDVNAPSVTSSTPSAIDVMRLLYESASTSDTAFGDLTQMPWAERQRLATLLEERGQPLSAEDKSRLERGKDADLKALLKKIQAGASEERARTQSANARAQDAVSLTPTKTPDLGVAPTRIPADGEHPAAEASPLAQTNHEGDLATATHARAASAKAPCTDTATLARARQALLAMVTASATPQTHVANKPDGLARTHQALLGETVAVPHLVRGFPAAGCSGMASRIPLLQFAPEMLRATFEALGIHTLADFLVRGLLPEARLLMASMCGVPADMLLVVLYRAELLDLPLQATRGLPHPKDLILLSRLGLGTAKDLARLGQLFEAQPELLTLFAKLLAGVQRADSDYVGRQSITRHELKLWTQAATRRGSMIEAPHDHLKAAYTDGTENDDDIAQEVMGWHLTHRYATDSDLLDTVLYNAIIWLRERCADTQELVDEAAAAGSDALRRALTDTEELDSARLETTRLAEDRRRAALQQATADDERWRAAQHALDEETLAYRERGWSVMREITPRLSCGHRDVNGRVGYWIMPRPTDSDVDGRPPPPGARPLYVYIDPDSGALEPAT